MAKILAETVAVGDIVLGRTLGGEDTRQRVTNRQDLVVRITSYGVTTAYPTVRLNFGGMSLDYAPDLPVDVVR
jgi:hypothetical protein